ncbi:hypothetical protein BS17DRAFT_811316 [Gyrodon lividus]|nr:hypothetical protein BS17DRAFT_811316 [Gyrodon lividus]
MGSPNHSTYTLNSNDYARVQTASHWAATRFGEPSTTMSRNTDVPEIKFKNPYKRVNHHCSCTPTYQQLIVDAGIPQAGATPYKLPTIETDCFTTPDRDDHHQRSQIFDRHDHYVHTGSSNPKHNGEFSDADLDDLGESKSVLSLLCPDDSCTSNDENSALCSDSGQSTGPVQDDSDEDEDGWDPEMILTFSEHRALLNGYIHVFVNDAYKRATHSASEETLMLLQSTIKSCYPPG